MATERRGQALIELAAGLFALSLVVSALCLFATYIAKSLHQQNTLRGLSPAKDETVSIDAFMVDIVGAESLKVQEKAILPPTT